MPKEDHSYVCDGHLGTGTGWRIECFGLRSSITASRHRPSSPTLPPRVGRGGNVNVSAEVAPPQSSVTLHSSLDNGNSLVFGSRRSPSGISSVGATEPTATEPALSCLRELIGEDGLPGTHKRTTEAYSEGTVVLLPMRPIPLGHYHQLHRCGRERRRWTSTISERKASYSLEAGWL